MDYREGGCLYTESQTDERKPMEHQIREAIDKTKSDGSKHLGYDGSRRVLSCLGIPQNAIKFASTVEEACGFAEEIGYPVVLKLVSKEIVHKTEVGGVRTHVNSADEVSNVFENMKQRALASYPDATIDGVMVEEQVSGPELFIGTTCDPHFGPMIAFGIGGIFVEVYKDISFRLVPLEADDAKEMLSEIQGKSILTGIRGLPKTDEAEAVDLLLKVSKFMQDYPEVAEVDINPIMATEKGLVAVDARIVLE